MPIYAYRCEACGFAKDVLQKVSDPQLTVCLECGAPQFRKQVTAAGFQLKGTGWYATDFRNGAGTTTPAVANPAGGDAAAKGGDKAGAEKGADKPAAGGTSSAGGSTAAGTGSATSSSGSSNSPPSSAS